MHRHKWKVVDKIKQQSTLEAYRSQGMRVSFKNAWPDELEKLSRNPYIVTYECEKCGTQKVKRI